MACLAPAQTNIAPTGQGYYWFGMKSATVTTNQTATSLINDGNVSNTLNCDATGETATNRYEGAGVIFSSAQSNINSVAFINGPLDANGNGNFEANLSLQTYNGSAWSVASGWTVSPAYPYTTAAAGKTYTFTGPTLNGVLGVRVVGEVRVAAIDNSWSWTVNEVMIYASTTQTANFTLTASPSSQSVTAGSNADYTVTVTPQNGFTGTVNLTVSGQPTGWTPTVKPHFGQRRLRLVHAASGNDVISDARNLHVNRHRNERHSAKNCLDPSHSEFAKRKRSLRLDGLLVEHRPQWHLHWRL